MPQKIKIVDYEEYKRVDSLVGDHKYKVFSSASDVPFGLTKGNEANFMSCVVVGSGYEPKQEINYPDQSLTPSGTLYLVRIARKCSHDDKPHINIDDYLFYSNIGGKCIKVGAHESKDHYCTIMNASPLGTLLEYVNAIPNNAEGTLEEYVSNCASLDFVKNCPGLPESDLKDS